MLNMGHNYKYGTLEQILFHLQLKLLLYNQSVFKQENIKQYLKNPTVLYYLNFDFIALQKTNENL